MYISSSYIKKKTIGSDSELNYFRLEISNASPGESVWGEQNPQEAFSTFPVQKTICEIHRSRKG